MVWTLYMVQVDLFRVQMDLFWAKNDILGQIWLKKWKMFRIHKDIRFPGGIFLACLDGNRLHFNPFSDPNAPITGSNRPIFCQT